MLVTAGTAVDQTLQILQGQLEPGDLISTYSALCYAHNSCLSCTVVDAGNEWYENTEQRAKTVLAKVLTNAA